VRRLLALAVIVALAWLSQRASAGVAPAAHATLVAGIVMLAGYVAGHLVARLGLPRISGYLLAGLVLGPHVAGLLSQGAIDELHFLNELAVCFIALAAGSELRLGELRGRLRVIGATIACLVAVVLTAVTSFVYFVGYRLLPFSAGMSDFQWLGVAVLFGVLAVARSPASAIAIIRETRARGPFTEMALGVTVAMDAVVIILFAVGLSFCESVMHPGATPGLGFLAAVAAELVAGLALGVAVGRGLAFYMARVRTELPVVLLGTALLVAELSHGMAGYLYTTLGLAIKLEPLLICVTAGFTVQNFSDQGERSIRALDTVNLPVFVLFFCLAGAHIDLNAVRATGVVALALVLVRAAAVFSGASLGGRLGGDPPARYRLAGLAFLTQAGVALGLSMEVLSRFPGWGEQFATTVVAVVAVNEIIGPIALRHALGRAGEVRLGVTADDEGPASAGSTGPGEARPG